MALLSDGELDREVAARLGRERSCAAGYSTRPGVADRVLADCEECGLFWQIEQSFGLWYCILSRRRDGSDRLATGSGETRELAVCRAFLNLPAGVIQPTLPAKSSSSPAVLRHGVALAVAPCENCGSELPTKGRTATFRVCAVCSWKRSKRIQEAFEQTRKSRLSIRRET
jgi:hypothetical protein